MELGKTFWKFRNTQKLLSEIPALFIQLYNFPHVQAKQVLLVLVRFERDT